MALGSTMLQLSVKQETDQDVSEVGEFFAEVFEFLSFGTVTVREIALEKGGGITVTNSATIPFDYSDTGYATLRLLFSSSSKDEVFFLAPSHVPSPPVNGAGLALLEVFDTHVISAGTNLSVSRRLGAHAYFDEF